MGALAIWKRLLWKELREGWPVLVAAAAAPAALFPAAWLFPQGSFSNRLPLYIASVGARALVVLWASGRGERRAGKNDPVPASVGVSAPAQWLASVVAPCIAIGFLGVWLGVWESVIRPGSFDLWLVDDRTHYLVLAGLLMMATYACVYALSAISSRWLAMAVWSFLFLLYMQVRQGPDVASFLRFCFFGSLAASLLFNILMGKGTLRYARVASAVLLMVVCLGPYAHTLLNRPQWHYRFDAFRVSITSEDGAMKLKSAYWGLPNDDNGANPYEYVLRDWRYGKSYRKSFPPVTVPLGFAGDGEVMLAQQRPDSVQISILQWQPRCGKLTRMAVVSVGVPKAIGYDTSQGTVSPDGHYVLLSTPVRKGRWRDLWVVNLKTGASKLAFPNEWCLVHDVAWVPGRAILSPFTPAGPIVVDLKAMTAEWFSLPKDHKEAL